MSALSVSTTATMSPGTSSPSATSHSTTVPNSMSAPSDGMRNSPIVATLRRPARRGHDLVDATAGRLPRVLRRASGPPRCTPAARARRGRRRACSVMRALISAERLPLRHPSSTITARWVAHAGHDRGVVERPQRPQVDHLGVDALGGELLGGVEAGAQRAAVGDDREVAPPAPHGARSMPRHLGGGVHRTAQVVERPVLEDEHRVGIGERLTEHPAGVVDRGRREHLDARGCGRTTLEAVGVLRGELAAGRRWSCGSRAAPGSGRPTCAGGWRRCS
jgi:hypothetical protein